MTSAVPSFPAPRKAKQPKRDPESHKRALISATLDTIAEIGITDTSVREIVERAGLSRGMIHLHYGGKSQLLAAAAEAFSKEYYKELDRFVTRAGDDPEGIILSVIDADLSEGLMNVRTTGIWHAFRGAARTDPGIAAFSNTRDERLREIVQSAFNEIARNYPEPASSTLARDATLGLLALLEGMWVDYLSNSDAFSRQTAKSIIRRFLAGLFPSHFR